MERAFVGRGHVLEVQSSTIAIIALHIGSWSDLSEIISIGKSTMLSTQHSDGPAELGIVGLSRSEFALRITVEN